MTRQVEYLLLTTYCVLLTTYYLLLTPHSLQVEYFLHPNPHGDIRLFGFLLPLYVAALIWALRFLEASLVVVVCGCGGVGLGGVGLCGVGGERGGAGQGETERAGPDWI